MDLYKPWHVSGTLKLDWGVYPWHIVRFWDCKGFVIDANNTLLDLNDHTVMFKKTILGPGLSGVEIIGKSEVTIRNGTIIDFQYGLWVQDSSDVHVEFNNVSASGKNGIWARNSKNVSIGFNSVSASGDVAIGIDSACMDVSIHNNLVLDNDREAIYLKDSNHNIVSDNTVSRNGYYGIYTYNSANNTITSNIVSDNPPTAENGGIYLDDANYNVLSENTILNNPKGIEMKSSSSNIIYHNNFVNNTKDVECSASNNVWDVGYGTVKDTGYGGNYWDEYTSPDKFSGKRQDVLGSDGIGDTPYSIDTDNRDRYPLMSPWGTMLVLCDLTWRLYEPNVGWKDVNCYAVIFSNSSVTDHSFNRTGGEMSFTTINGTFCKVIVSKEALGSAFTVTLDDFTTASIVNWDETHHFIYFSLTIGRHIVKIKGETVTKLIGDLNGDGKVSLADIFVVAKDFGKEIK